MIDLVQAVLDAWSNRAPVGPLVSDEVLLHESAAIAVKTVLDFMADE